MRILKNRSKERCQSPFFGQSRNGWTPLFVAVFIIATVLSDVLWRAGILVINSYLQVQYILFIINKYISTHRIIPIFLNNSVFHEEEDYFIYVPSLTIPNISYSA